jgi:S-adenosylmethionine:tRNA ribosyltransferase-isomerase
MLLSQFDFPFDPALVALRPVEPRDAARLMVVPVNSSSCRQHRIADLPHLLQPHDVLVLNDTKVLPARITGYKRPGGGKIEMVFVKEMGQGLWETLLRGGKPGQLIDVDQETSASIVRGGRQSIVRVNSPRPFRELLAEKGQMPLPPYIKRAPTDQDRTWYQTVYARSNGSIAAPTAGLHFTEELLAALRRRGINVVSVTLHVGLGTFRPVRTADIDQHTMGSEPFEVPAETAVAIHRARQEGGRIVAVGTTTVRALEAAVDTNGEVRASKGETDLFIVPGYQFRIVSGLLTNFHLPRSTLLMLVSAFAGLERMRAAYEEAIRERYRLYSYGDAMLIL